MGACTSIQKQPEIDLDVINYAEEARYLYVICPMFNPARSGSRIKQYLSFKREMEKFGVKLITVECAFKNSPFTLTRQNYEPHNIQVTTNSSFFQKERLINIGLSKLPLDAKYVVWCDCKVEFTNPNWVNDTIKLLHIFKAAQPFEDVILCGENGEESSKEKGFASVLYGISSSPSTTATPATTTATVPIPELTESCGYCWAFQVEALKAVGGLFDFSPIGNCDKIMACCLANRIEEYLPATLNERFKKQITIWQKKALETFVPAIGFMPGTIKVAWSDSNKPQDQVARWDILELNNFNPKEDFEMDKNELYMVKSENLRLKSDLKSFFQSSKGEVAD